MNIDKMLEVSISKPDDFLKIAETLTRMGVASEKSNTLYQSCHILHKRGKYYIVHFKEMFLLDGKQTEILENDLARRNTIACLLEEWNLLKIVDKTKMDFKVSPKQIKIIPFKSKSEWKLESKYKIGKKK